MLSGTERRTAVKISNVNPKGQAQRPAGDINALIAAARDHAFLTVAEERELLTRFQKDGDPAAAERLVGSHLRLVIRIARDYRGYGLPFADMVAEGYLGLMQALERFDASHEVRLATYASWWIRAQMQEYVLRSQSLVKMGTTAPQKKLFYNLRRMKAKLGETGDGDLSPESVAAIARELQVPENDVVEMNRRMQAGDASLNASYAGEGETEWQERLVDDSQDPESRVVERDELDKRRIRLAQSMEGLTERERDIIRERRLRDEPLTLEALSQRYDISRERVRQIEARALEKLRAGMIHPALRAA
jgi:RNA polymerase sigma-32 factor